MLSTHAASMRTTVVGTLDQPPRTMAWNAEMSCVFEKTATSGWPSLAVSLLTGAVDPSRVWICRCGGRCKILRWTR